MKIWPPHGYLWLAILLVAGTLLNTECRDRQRERDQQRALQILARQQDEIIRLLSIAVSAEERQVRRNYYLIKMYQSVETMQKDVRKRQQAIEDAVRLWDPEPDSNRFHNRPTPWCRERK